ncbi:protein JTB-like isoform X2 [Corticium candelabrum]|uniref:protein JTB-like isoform X2 n=1 Tax=Corticium candelabrum TaxID=121492 RepID=UPI002E253E28|nr:protein JTB-like isoform X2 [Corticium candelabrum]
MKEICALVLLTASVVLVGGLEDDLPLSEATSNSQVSHSQCTRILEECRPCVEQDKRWQLESCEKTGLHEKVRCNDGKEKFVSCSRSKAIEARNFWIFETVAFAIGVVSYIVVKLRQKQLDRAALQRIRKQVSSAI